MFDVTVIDDASMVKAILDGAVEGVEWGKLPLEPYAGPHLNSIWPLNRSNARLVAMDGLQSLLWFDDEAKALFLEFRLAQPWFPGHHWPGPCRSWPRASLQRNPDQVINQARRCLDATSSIAVMKATAVKECEGTGALFLGERRFPDFEGWMSQYMIASAVGKDTLTPNTTRKSAAVIEQALGRYFAERGVSDYTKMPAVARRAICLAGWQAVEIVAAQTGVTRQRSTPRAFTT